jgi:hypothetical protein
MPLEVKQLDTQSAAVFTNLMKEESYPHFEVRAMVNVCLDVYAIRPHKPLGLPLCIFGSV